MSSDATVSAPAAGQGRLAEVIATRGGLAAPEAPFVIEHREALIYMLCEAAELEHGIMCQYLFAAFSLKQAADEGLTEAELAAVTRWRRQISHVAAQEMLHLALVHNLLSAVGAAPHLGRPNLPAPAAHYPAGVQLALLPFGERALRHFMYLERPEGMDLEDADGMAAMGRTAPVLSERDIVPRGQDFATVGHLYRSIEAGLTKLVDKHSEDWLFVGPPRAQATEEHFGWPELVAVTDLASACRAIEEILEQGEGPRGHWRDAHFGQFVAILDEYQGLRQANPGFDPVRPVLAANVRTPERDVEVPLISDPLTARVTDLFNVGYEILLQMFERFFAHASESDAQLRTLADASVAVMLRVIRPLGDLITTLPVGDDHPGRTAGPSFELFYESDYLMPHRHAAWALLAERLDEAAWLCDELAAGRGRRLAGQLEPVLAALQDISKTMAAQLPPGSAHARLAAAPDRLRAAELDALGGRAAELAASVAAAAASGPGETAGALAGVFETARSIVTAASERGCDGREQALIVPRLVDSVLRPLSTAIRRAGPTPNGSAPAGPGTAPATGSGSTGSGSTGSGSTGSGSTGSGSTAPGGTASSPPRSRSGSLAAWLWEAARAATSLRARLGAAGTCPPELAEATAALQDLAIRLAPRDQASERRAELWRLQAGLPASIQASRNGPYLVTNVPRLTDHLGAQTEPAPQLALCRCGNSAIKPLCDGSHASTGFTGAKDPKRVADRRDTYTGQQLTIFDNRGICQHSGFCTDRVAAAFRAGAEPFVAASGGRMDEIIRAVRDCPSGALSYAIDGIEARDQVDWGATRPPAIEVTRDGPYRITGRIALVGADGTAEPGAAGASAEHYALCRCGHSQNKPFCSGMHWYIDFRDPVPVGEPSPFEWAGGLAALTRMSRLLYEKHIPADPLLAPAFAAMPAAQPQLLAGWLAGALGGPAKPDWASPGEAVGATPGQAGDAQRARWVTLAHAAADDARLPADPSFRAVLSSCLDWLARAALGPAAADQPTPRWGWGPAGPPAAPAADAADAAPPPDLPAAGQPVSFARHIKPLFRPRDRQSMSFAFDLWSHADVSAHAAGILRRLRDGSMPCDGAWPGDRIEVFARWADTGRQP